MAVWSEINLTDINQYSRIDGDFYQPEYLEYRKKLNGHKNLSHFISEIIHPGEFKRIYSESGVAVLRAQNIRPMRIDADSNSVFIPRRVADNLSRNKIKNGDVLITRTGANFGQTALYIEENSEAIVTSHTFILKTNENINSAYLALYLNTKYGRKLLDQGMYGSSQPEIAPKFIKIIPIPVFSKEIENKISEDVVLAYKLRKQSQSLYQQATTLLDKELGLDKIIFEKPKSYIANFSEVVNSNRADADFYQFKFKQLEEHISNLQATTLASICSFQKGYEVGTKLYTEEGPIFIRVSNLTINGFTFGKADKYISNNTYNIFKAHKPNIGDILLTKDGTIGTCYVVDEEVEGIVSSGIMNLTLNDTSIPKEYLALVINSQICQMQADRDCSGALITHWKPEQIRKMKIPILSSETMEHLAGLITRSKAARKESKQLLEQAKNRVEELIEEVATK